MSARDRVRHQGERRRPHATRRTGVQDAIVIYYRNLIQYTLETIRTKLETAQNMPTFIRPIDVVCGGGTSMITGFIDVFREEFEKINFPIEVARVRMANDPLKAVSRGCMVAAIEETRANLEPEVRVGPATLERTTAQVSKMDDGTKRRLGAVHTQPERLPGGPQRVAPVKIAAASAAPSMVPAVKVTRTEATAMPPAIVRGRDEGQKVLKVAPSAQPPKKDTSVRAKPFGSIPTPPPPPPPKKKEADLELVEELDIEEITDLTAEPKGKDGTEDIPLIS